MSEVGLFARISGWVRRHRYLAWTLRVVWLAFATALASLNYFGLLFSGLDPLPYQWAFYPQFVSFYLPTVVFCFLRGSLRASLLLFGGTATCFVALFMFFASTEGYFSMAVRPGMMPWVMAWTALAMLLYGGSLLLLIQHSVYGRRFVVVSRVLVVLVLIAVVILNALMGILLWVFGIAQVIVAIAALVTYSRLLHRINEEYWLR